MTFGTPDTLPLLYSEQPPLMTKGRQQAVVRVGALQSDSETTEAQTLNWSTAPRGTAVSVRMSGLLWPEAAARIANSAYVTRERVGKGQVILFSGQPNFRGSTRGVGRVWLNALVYGQAWAHQRGLSFKICAFHRQVIAILGALPDA